ncbi:MAG: protoporphyrinogen/coproporphyrinogen oxidase [Bacteroidales bacterium]
MTNKVAVIGAGISGLSVSSFMKDKGYDVSIFESSENVGGLVKCDIVDGVLFHRVGGHVFNTKNKVIEHWFWSKFKKEDFISTDRNAKVLIDNNIEVGYPIENSLYLLEPNLTSKIIKDFLELSGKDIDVKRLDNFGDFLRYNFGTTLYEYYFKPYNEKIWNVDLASIPLPWLDGKLPMPNFLETIVSNIFRKDEKNMVHSSFYYPQKGGSQFIVNQLSSGLDIKLNSKISSIVRLPNSRLLIEGTEYDTVVYTGDVRELSNILQNIHLDSNLDAKIKSLRSNATCNVLCEVKKNDLSWLYLPSSNIAAHRIIFTGNFSSENNGNRSGTTCTVEFSGEYSEDYMLEEISKLPWEVKPLSFNREPNSYVIQDFNTRNNINALKNILEQSNIYLLGRFAEWEYYNMDKAMEAALKLVKKKCGYR